MNITLRPVSRDELIETVHIYLECLCDDYSFKPRPYLDERSADAAGELAECEEWLYTPGSQNCVLGAFTGQSMIGYIAVGPNTGEPQGYEGEVCGFFIRRAYRGQGIGLKLLRAGIEYLRGLGYSKVMLYNYRISEANSYYRRLGGEVVHEMIQHPGGMALETDVFAWETDPFLQTLDERLKKYPV